jgi:hypothetical protein
MQTLGTIILGAAALACNSSVVQAGRIGGPTSGPVNLAGKQSAVFDVPFAGGESAIVTAVANGGGRVGLALYDADGNTARGVGLRGRKTATMNLQQPGTLRIEVRNLDQQPAMFFLRTN